MVDPDRLHRLRAALTGTAADLKQEQGLESAEADSTLIGESRHQLQAIIERLDRHIAAVDGRGDGQTSSSRGSHRD